MAQVIGHVNEVSGLFYAKVGVDETRLLKVGDTLFKGEEIAGGSGNSASDILKLSIDSSGEELSVLSHNQLLLDDTLLTTTIDDLEKLEAPAAGDTEVDTLVGRFSERTAGETNISTDLRDASFVDPEIVIGNDVIAEDVNVNVDESEDIQHPPLALDDSGTTLEDVNITINILANDSDLDSDTLIVNSITQPTNGHAILHADGTVTYVPNDNYHGNDSFIYVISDGTGETDTAVVYITVTSQNDISVVTSGTGSITEDVDVISSDGNLLKTSGTIDVIDVDESESEVTPQVGAQYPGGYGIFTISSDGSWIYTANNDDTRIQALDEDSDPIVEVFTVVSKDGSATSTVTITINGTDDGIVVDSDAGIVAEDLSHTVSGVLTASDIDIDDAPVSFIAQTDSSSPYGTFSIDINGNWNYVLDDSSINPLVDGLDEDTPAIVEIYNVVVTNGDTDEDVTTVVTITINGTNDIPTIIGAVGEVFENDLPVNAVYSGTFAIADTDGLSDISDIKISNKEVQIDSLVGTIIVTAHSELKITNYDNNTGIVSFTYTLTHNVNSNVITNDTFEISVSDDGGGSYSSPSKVIITIADDVPTITNSLDATLTNEMGNAIIGIDLDIDTGADTPIGVVLTPEVNNEGFAIDSTGLLLTSTIDNETYSLVYLPTVSGSIGSVTAYQYIDATTTGDAVFTLIPDIEGGKYTGTYSINIDGKLDGVGYTLTLDLKEDNATNTGGNVDSYTFVVDNTTTDTDDDLNVLATGSTIGGDPLNVNFSAGLGLGVDHGAKINSGEILTLEFDKSLNDGTTFTLDHVGNNDVVGITLYDGDTPLTGVSFTVTNEVLEITDLGSGTIFDKIEFTNLDSGNGYTVESLSADINTELSGITHTINVGVEVTDSDLDIASGDIEITFDEDGVLSYDSDTIIDGGTEDDTLLVGDDTLLDFSTFSDGSVTDIENVDLRGGVDTTVTNLTVESVFDVTDSNNMLNILGGNTTDSVQVSTTEWGTSTGTTSVDGVNYNQYEATYNDGFVNQTVYLNVQDEVVEEIV